MPDELDNKLRSIKYQVEQNSERIDKIVDGLVAKYNKDLDRFINDTKELLDNADRLSDNEIENLTLRVPIYMYFGVNGVESLGIQLDNAKAVKMESYNAKFMESSGTIADKTAESENGTLPEYLMVVCYDRAYKKLKAKMDVATQICQSTRKVLQKRISELDINKTELNYQQGDNQRENKSKTGMRERVD